MPSEYQNGTGTQYDTEAEKMLDTKNDATLRGLIDGMDDPDRVQEWIETEAEGDSRTEIIGALNRKKADLRGGE